MTRQRAILILVALGTAIIVVTVYTLLPNTYKIAEHLGRTTIFWNDREAFLLLSVSTEGRATNIVQQKLGGTRYGPWALVFGANAFRLKQSINAYHLLSSGRVDDFELPDGAGVYGNWAIRGGELQFRPSGNINSNLGDPRLTLRWNGKEFVIVAAGSAPSAENRAANRNQAGDDDYTEDTAESVPETKLAGWHQSTLAWNPSNATNELPLKIGRSTFTLVLRGSPFSKQNFLSFDALTMGVKELDLTSQEPAQPRVLWRQNGWKAVSKVEFQRLPTLNQQMHRTTSSLIWLVVLLGLLLSRWGHWVLTLIRFAAMKSGTLKQMPSAFSLPPASPAQFPFLDSRKLDQYTSDFESMGFIRLMDFSIIGDGSQYTPNFCRLFGHSGHHCFGEIYQFFPVRRGPQLMKCSIQCCLQDGWEIDFSNSKPKAEHSLFQPRKTIRVNMPQLTTSQLLQEFLKLRQQVCLDLGISLERDDTLEAYIRKAQRAAVNMRETIKSKNFAVGLSQVYFRKFSFLKTRQEYMSLGDYPKEAERRKQGYLAVSN